MVLMGLCLKYLYIFVDKFKIPGLSKKKFFLTAFRTLIFFHEISAVVSSIIILPNTYLSCELRNNLRN